MHDDPDDIDPNPTDVDRFARFLTDYYREEIADLAREYPLDRRTLFVAYDDLFRWDPDVADDAREHYGWIRAHLEAALPRVDIPIDVDWSDANVRLLGLGDDHTVSSVRRSDHIGDLVELDAQVAKVSEVKPRLTTAVFVCGRCGVDIEVHQPEADDLRQPQECPGCERQGPFTVDEASSEWTDHQQARLQEPPERQADRGGTRTIDVELEDDLIGLCTAGDRVTATGTFATTIDDTATAETYLEGEAVTHEESSYEDIDIADHRDTIEEIAAGEHGDPYDLLVDSINPKHHGDRVIKLSLGLMLFGGWPREHPDGSRDRGDSHVLLLGDPGCGKSSFLQAVDNIAPRSTYASGKGATAAGMTAAAVQDDFGDSEWSLEAGAMVLADGGVACVDEIDKMHSDAVSSMHEALEAQKVHIDKAGIDTDLPARTALLAAGNPEGGRFDPFQSIPQQIDLAPSLLSRFDLMFMVSDDPDPDRDAEVVGHMVESRSAAGTYTLDGERALSEAERERIQPAIAHDTLRAYIALAKEECHPQWDDPTLKEHLQEYFVEFRKAGSEGAEDANNPVPVTFRRVQAVQRLAEASARVRLDDQVRLEDVERAVDLVQRSMQQVGYDPETGQFDADLIHSGSSRSQRQRRQELQQWIRQEQGADGGVARSAILSWAEGRGYDADLVDGDVDDLIKKGELYRAGEGEVRLS